MNRQASLTYLIYVDDDHIPVTGSMTVGNHLENDIVIAGEDVADFHVRLELTDRGPVLVPLGDATANVNGVERGKPVQVIVGDVISIGQSTMQVGYEIEADKPTVDHWVLVPEEDGNEIAVHGEIAIGRAESADVCLLDTHISRYHARLLERDNVVWLQDLNSANGSRVNGNRIAGGVRLFHGDKVSFDQYHYQLLARGGDLTPIASFQNPAQGTSLRPPEPTRTDAVGAHQPAESAVVVAELRLLVAPAPGAPDTGAASYPVVIGDNFLGSASHNEVVLEDPSVADRHARLTVKPEGAVLTSLLGRGHLRINGAEMSSCLLEDGDVIDVGQVRVQLHMKPQPLPPHAEPPSPPARGWAGLLVLGLLGAALVALLLLR